MWVTPIEMKAHTHTNGEVEETIFQNNDVIALTLVGHIKWRNTLGMIWKVKYLLSLKEIYCTIIRPAMLYKIERWVVESR